MSFVFVICQAGAETALKDELAKRHPDFRFAYSRPGFVTFKVPPEVRSDRQFELKSVFARTWGHSIGKVSGTDGRQLCREFWDILSERFPAEVLARFSSLHVWQRDEHIPGDRGFEPGISPLAEEVGQMLLAARPEVPGIPAANPLKLNEIAAPDERIIDCVLVEPGEWWIGWHKAAGVVQTTWPGGVPVMDVPDEIISRTYLKMAEALLWSGLPLQPGDACVEIGSSPGGSCQCLLERGLFVTGVDPADMDESLLRMPGFTHLKARAKDLKRRVFSEFKWLMSDASVAPRYTLDTVEAIVTHPGIRIEGLLLTLKLTDWRLAKHIPEYHKRVRSWGYQQVWSRQLAFNRQEICLAASSLAAAEQTGSAGRQS